MARKEFTFDDYLGKTFDFYGVDERKEPYKFKIGDQIIEVHLDENDGYRSRLGAVCPGKGGKFKSRPLAVVTVREISRRNPYRTSDDPLSSPDTGYALVGEDGHVWLSFGTDEEDSYYPMFCFNYSPKETKADA